jgi:hypothetical protein
MLSATSTNIEFYLQPTGTPNGVSVFYTTGVTLTPVLMHSSPAVGSPGGSIIKATVKGVGISTTSAVTLTNSAGTDLC